jgi:hypothetical protein
MSEHPPDRPTPDVPITPPNKDDQTGGGKGSRIAQKLRGKGFFAGYKLCRRSGLAPWCSVRLAIQYGI